MCVPKIVISYNTQESVGNFIAQTHKEIINNKPKLFTTDKIINYTYEGQIKFA